MTDPAVPDVRLEQIRERAENATPGPWAEPYYDDNPGDRGWWINNGRQGSAEYAVCVTFALNPSALPDARFIAAAREDIPWLLDRLREARDENERLRGQVAAIEALIDPALAAYQREPGPSFSAAHFGGLLAGVRAALAGQEGAS